MGPSLLYRLSNCQPLTAVVLPVAAAEIWNNSVGSVSSFDLFQHQLETFQWPFAVSALVDIAVVLDQLGHNKTLLVDWLIDLSLNVEYLRDIIVIIINIFNVA